MLKERRQRHVEWLREYGNRSRAVTQSFEYSSPCRVRQGIEDVIERDCLLRHMPNYRAGD